MSFKEKSDRVLEAKSKSLSDINFHGSSDNDVITPIPIINDKSVSESINSFSDSFNDSFD